MDNNNNSNAVRKMIIIIITQRERLKKVSKMGNFCELGVPSDFR